MKKNLTIKMVADSLGTSERTIYRMISDGELVAFKVRGCLRITEESLDAYRYRQISKYQIDNGINSLSGTDRD